MEKLTENTKTSRQYPKDKGAKMIIRCSLYFLVLAFLNLVTGCGYYKVITKENVSKEELAELAEKNKYFIVHEPDTVWHLAKPHFSQNNILGDKNQLAEWHRNYELGPAKKNNKYNRKDTLEKQVVNEVHLYTLPVLKIDSVRIMIPVDSIFYYQIYQSQNTGVLIAMISAGAIAIIVICMAILASKVAVDVI